MTQMLLFDPPASSENYAPSVVPVAERADEATAAAPQQAALENDADRGGMHHMGDLARLVLMRYELVAKRRAALAAKRGEER